MAIVELEEVTKRYGNRTAVDRLSLGVAEGETLVLLGPSGSGKTTVLKMINRIIDPSDGQIRVFGEDAQRCDPVGLRRRIGYVIQSVGLFPHYTVRRNVAVVPELLGWSEGSIAARVAELLGLVGLQPDEFAERMPAELSGGQRQRVGLARALAADPPLVLLDEPFGALDPMTRHKLQKEFSRLKATLKKTMVLVTHDIAEAVALGDRICLIDDGRVRQVGRPRELLFRPNDGFVRSFFDTGRLQLELMTTPVSDLLDTRGVEGREGTGQAISVDAGVALGELLENPLITDASLLTIDCGANDAAYTTRAELLAVFVRRRSVAAS